MKIIDYDLLSLTLTELLVCHYLQAILGIYNKINLRNSKRYKGGFLKIKL